VVKETEAPKIPVENANRHKILSPMAGTFYRAPSPTSPPYVEEGQKVTAGQPVCIVEAMKLMNEIKADKTGKIVKILVENAKPVEKGSELFIIELGE
jgi:acetyl-CoA carboxylase biotin carboxyl carrier protein